MELHIPYRSQRKRFYASLWSRDRNLAYLWDRAYDQNFASLYNPFRSLLFSQVYIEASYL